MVPENEKRVQLKKIQYRLEVATTSNCCSNKMGNTQGSAQTNNSFTCRIITKSEDEEITAIENSTLDAKDQNKSDLRDEEVQKEANGGGDRSETHGPLNDEQGEKHNSDQGIQDNTEDLLTPEPKKRKIEIVDQPARKPDQNQDSPYFVLPSTPFKSSTCFDEEDHVPLSQLFSRKKKAMRRDEVLDDDDDDDDDDSDDAVESSSEKLKDNASDSEIEEENQKEVRQDGDEYLEKDNSKDSDHEDDCKKRKRGRKASLKKAEGEHNVTDEAPKGKYRGPSCDRTCPHCGKVFSVKDGLQYHIDNFVCRPTLNPNKEMKKKRGRKKLLPDKEGSKSKKSPKFRGPKENRTCPRCQREFTSVLGLNYHVERSVCQQKPPLPFATLEPGSQFVTSFGIVEVVADNRATPTATYADDVKKLTRGWSSWKSKRDAQLHKVWVAAAVQQRCRRYQLTALTNANDSSKHQDGLTQESVWNAYFGGNPSKIPRSQWKVPVSPGPFREDPLFPKESYPERIVECILLPDRRQKLWGLDDQVMYDAASAAAPAGANGSVVRLFLQRKLLTEPYKAGISVWCCNTCGGYFNSKTGMKFHLDSQVCKKAKARIVTARAGLQQIEERARRQPLQKELKRAWKPKRKKEDSMYPQVWISLGFKLLPNKKPTQLLHAPEQVVKQPEPEVKVEEPENVLRVLRHQLQFLVKVQNVSLGPMYPEVFQALGYKKPSKRKRKKRRRLAEDEEEVQEEDRNSYRPRRRRRTLPKPPPPPRPLPPTIDVRALADEVDCGRYPSVKRYKEDEHDEVCFICKEGGTLFCCDFCRKAVHMDCMLDKFTVKVPEPEDDFMCHRCIQYILQRRARAEKRRIRKQQLKKANHIATGEIPADMVGMEYEYLATQGQEVSELIELIQDAQTRLRLALEAEKVNDIRRTFIESCECLEPATTPATTTATVGEDSEPATGEGPESGDDQEEPDSELSE